MLPTPNVELGPGVEEPSSIGERPLYIYMREPRILGTAGERVNGVVYQYVTRDEAKRIISDMESELRRNG